MLIFSRSLPPSAAPQVPLAHLLHGAPHLMPRYYTISSSASAHPRRIHATVAVLESPRPNGEPPLRGVCRCVPWPLRGVCGCVP